MGQNDLVAEVREGRGKGVARKLRAAGRIPAVLYGRGKESRSLFDNYPVKLFDREKYVTRSDRAAHTTSPNYYDEANQPLCDYLF